MVHFNSGVTQDPEPYFKEVKQTRTKEQIPVEAHVFGFKKTHKNMVRHVVGTVSRVVHHFTLKGKSLGDVGDERDAVSASYIKGREMVL